MNFELRYSYRKSIIIPWFLSKTINAEWLVVYLKLWWFHWQNENNRKNLSAFFFSNCWCGWFIPQDTTQWKYFGFKNIYKYIFLTTQDLQPFIWLCYIDNIFFMWTHGEAELKKGLWRNWTNLTLSMSHHRKKWHF